MVGVILFYFVGKLKRNNIMKILIIFFNFSCLIIGGCCLFTPQKEPNSADVGSSCLGVIVRMHFVKRKNSLICSCVLLSATLQISNSFQSGDAYTFSLFLSKVHKYRKS